MYLFKSEVGLCSIGGSTSFGGWMTGAATGGGAGGEGFGTTLGMARFFLNFFFCSLFSFTLYCLFTTSISKFKPCCQNSNNA